MFETPVAPGRNVFLYVVKGEVSVAGTVVPQWNLAALGDGDAVQIAAVSDAVVLLGHAEPIGEPVFSHGPFVMNTREEIIQGGSGLSGRQVRSRRRKFRNRK